MLAPSQRYASREPTKPDGRRSRPTNPRNVRLGSALDSTRAASTSSPSSSTTPVARPPSIRTCLTSAPVLISAPASRAASAISAVTVPMPPRTNPHPTPPPEPPDAASCSRPYAVPGVDGPASVLLIDSHPSADFTMSSSKCSSRYFFADVANRNDASCRSRRCRNASRANRRRPDRSRALRIRGSGAVQSNTGISAEAIRPSVASYAGNARASRGDSGRMASTLRARSSCSTNVCPSGNTLSDGPAWSTRSPRSRRRMSSQIASRSIDSTYAPGEARNPGANSSVTHAPPTMSRRSSTSVRSPPRAR